MSRKTTTQPVASSSRLSSGIGVATYSMGTVLPSGRSSRASVGWSGRCPSNSAPIRTSDSGATVPSGRTGSRRLTNDPPTVGPSHPSRLRAVGVDRHDPTAQVEGGQPLTHQVGDVAQPPGLARQRPLAFDLLGHVRPDRDDTGGHATRVGEHAVADVDRERAAVGVYAVELALPAAGIQHRGPGLAAEHAVSCRQRQLDDVAPDGLGGGPPVQVPGAVVPDLHGPVEVGGDHRRSDGVEHLVAQVELAPCRPGQRPGVRRALLVGRMLSAVAVLSVLSGAGRGTAPTRWVWASQTSATPGPAGAFVKAPVG